MHLPVPFNEEKRLAEVRSYEVLDTLPDEALNELVSLAAELFDTPIALITVLDEARQWFKAKVGIDVAQTPRDMAFCAHTICQSEVMVVSDAASDLRFSTNPLVTGDPGIRFYAGAPLITPSGSALGTICVIDRKPRELSAELRKVLTVLSRQVVMQLELKRSLARRRKVEEELTRAHAELELRVQQRTEELHAACERAEAEAAERLRSEEAMRRRNDQLLRFEAALLKLATTRHAEFSGALHHTAEIAAHTLGLHTVTVWLFNRERDTLRCADFYRPGSISGPEQSNVGLTIRESDCPELFTELRTNLPITASDISAGDHADCLAHLLGDSEEIQSMLAVPIRIRGEMIGTLCLGQSGIVCEWDRGERDFAVSLSSVVALALEADERQRVEEALQESRFRLDLAIQAAQIGLWKWNLKTNTAWFSDEWKRQLGYEPDEIPNTLEEWSNRAHPDDVERVKEAIREHIQGASPKSDVEYRIQHRDGSWLWMLSRARVERDAEGKPVRVFGCHVDVSERHQLEDQLHALAAHLNQVREDERKGLARELHDELGQMLTALRMDVAWLVRTFTEGKEQALARIPKRTSGMKELIDQAISTVQRIASDLRPGMLDELGLVAALEWQVQEFEGRSGITSGFTSDVEEIEMAPACALTFYRVLQETLTNVARHSEASSVQVTFDSTLEHSSLEIRDNGRGLPEGALTAASSLGLTGIRERALAQGGEVTFGETAGGGTTVTLRIPAFSAV